MISVQVAIEKLGLVTHELSERTKNLVRTDKEFGKNGQQFGQRSDVITALWNDAISKKHYNGSLQFRDN